MKLSTTKEKILNAIQIAERIVGKKESLPVLSCVLLQAGKKNLSIHATNLEAAIRIDVSCDIGGEGVIAVPASILSQTLKSTLGDTVTLKDQDSDLLVESRGAKTLIKATPHDEFPIMGDGKGGEKFKLSKDRLLDGVKSVVYAASPSMIRPELGSIYVSITPHELTCVATDSFRLAERKITGTFADVETDILIPLKHTLELVHTLERVEDDEVSVILDESQLSVEGAGVRYTSRIVDGNFPNYKEIVPKKFEAEATLLKTDFIEILRKARIFSGNDQHVGLHIYPKKKLFSVTARSSGVGEMSDSLDAALSGDDLDINFHIGYLADCLPIIESESITLNFAGAGRPLIIRGASDTSFTYLVMPLNR